MEHDVQKIAEYLNLWDFKVQYEDFLGTLYLGEVCYVTVQCENITDFKNKIINYFSNKFDAACAKELNITFPYTVGDITFNSLSEMNAYILGTQTKCK